MKYNVFFSALCIYLILPIKGMEISNINNQENSILYMPWRAQYSNPPKNVPSSTPFTTEKKPCVFCTIGQENKDEKNYIVYRGTYAYVTIATQPYVTFPGIHLLAIPYAHGKELNALSPQATEEFNNVTKKICAYYSLLCNEIHVGFNIGKWAGASIPDHLHQHVVVDTSPRCNNLLLLNQRTDHTLDLIKIFKQAKQIFSGQENLPPLIKTSLSNNHNHCYYCKIFNQKEDKKNLILHRDNGIVVLLNHTPQRPGHISIFPQKHTEDIATLNQKKYAKINNLAIKIYPLILEIVNACDVNIGTTSYGQASQDKDRRHLRFDIIPRKEELIGSIDIISHKTAIATNINKLYEDIVNKFKTVL